MNPPCVVRASVCTAVLFAGNVACAQICGEGLAITRATGPGYLRLTAGVGDTCAEPTLQYVPAGVRYGSNGNVFVWLQNRGPLVEYTPDGAFVRIVASEGAAGAIQGRGIVQMPGGDWLVAGGSTNRVVRFNGVTGAAMADFVPAGAGGLASPFGLAYGPDGNLYVASFGSNQVLRYHGGTGAFLGVFIGAGSVVAPYDVTFGVDGNLYVTARDTGWVHHFNGATGAHLGIFTDTPLAPARGLRFGPNGNLFVCAWGGPAGDGVYEFNGATGALVRQVSAASAAMFLDFRCSPWTVTAPQDRSATVGESVTLAAQLTGAGPWTFQWRRDGVALTDGPSVFGATTGTLTLLAVGHGDEGSYTVTVANACGQTTAGPTALAVYCRADWDRNRQVNPADVAGFVTAWFESITGGTLAADFDGNGRVEPPDVAVFVGTWFGALGGC